ncbi:hypothetical protein V8E36_008375 [Tilletia maclaganii]
MFATTPSSLLKKLVPFLLLAASPATARQWDRKSDIRGHQFLETYSFYTGPDPTHGQVDYQQGPMLSWVDDEDRFNMKVDTHQNVGWNRGSVRMSSNYWINDGVIIANISHAPTGCGVNLTQCARQRPAFWTLGQGTWPFGGEIDILEWANNAEFEQGANSITLHTQPGCYLADADSSAARKAPQRGRLISQNCDVFSTGNFGCQVRARTTNGTYATAAKGFNAAEGGVVAMERDFSQGGRGIRVWQWARNDTASIPEDVLAQGKDVDTSTWGTPTASFNVNPSCKHAFNDHQIIFNIAVGGDWAKGAWGGTSCQERYGSMENFIQNRGDAFKDAYWTIDSVKHYV